MIKLTTLLKLATVTAICIPAVFAHAQDLPITWSDRVSVESSDGDIVDTPPFVKVGDVHLSRFSNMQSLILQETVETGADEYRETLHVFRAWQGGASQGEQLMIVAVSNNGVDVLGPYPQDFEQLKILPATDFDGFLFHLIGGNAEPITVLEYVAGQLLEKR